MVRLDTLFHLESGNDLELCYLNENDDGIAFVSRTAKNNGVSARVDAIPDIVPFKSGTITVSLGGSVLETFIHEEEYYTGYHIKVLTPKKTMTMEEMQYYCLCIKANKFKYSFGRQANKTISALMLPDRSEIPEWVYKKRNIELKDIPDYFLNEGYEKACWYLDNIQIDRFEAKYNGKINDKKINLDISKWKMFKISEIFPNCIRGKRQKSSDRISGDIPYYSASKENNGLTDFISNPAFVSCDALIYTTFGDSYYVEGEFTASDEITIFKSQELNKYNGMFISTILKMEQFRYSFGRKAFKNKINDTKILLPAKKNNDNTYVPDWDFMENYIKTINYSISI